RAAAQVEPVPGHDLLGDDGATDDVAPLEDGHAIAGLRQVRGGDQAVVAGADDDDVGVAAHPAITVAPAGPARPARGRGGRRNRINPWTTRRFVARKKTASSTGSGPIR